MRPRFLMDVVRLAVPALLLAALSSAPALAASPAPAPGASPSPPPDTYLGMPRGNRAIAVTLSTAVSGWGQYYNGEPEKGNLMLASMLTFPIAYGLDTLTNGSMMRVFSYVILVGVKSWSVMDAYQEAGKPLAAPSPSPTPAPARP